MIDLNMKVRAKKDGKMFPLHEGIYFCYKNKTYDATILEGDEENGGDYYYVDDETGGEYHGMDGEFFNEYFELKSDVDDWYDFFMRNSPSFNNMSMDMQGQLCMDAVEFERVMKNG